MPFSGIGWEVEVSYAITTVVLGSEAYVLHDNIKGRDAVSSHKEESRIVHFVKIPDFSTRHQRQSPFKLRLLHCDGVEVHAVVLE